jgi:glycosyltransferase involved in cell wall biosynthesis
MKPLSVAFVSVYYYPMIGGITTHIAGIASALLEKGVSVSVLTKQMDGLPLFEVVKGVPVYRISAPGPRIISSPMFLTMAIFKLRQLQPDMIHAHELTLATTTAIVAKYLLGIPVVATAHSSGLQLGEVARVKKAFLGHYRLKILRRGVDVFIANSRVIDEEMAAVNIPLDHRRFIRNGIDTQRFVPPTVDRKRELRKELNLPDVPIAVYIGRLSSEKRVSHLVAVWPAVRAVHPEALLLAVGTGPEESAIRQMGVTGVRLVGAVDDVVPYLQAADLFVLPSVSEGFSLATLEALSAGLPVVVTPVGLIPEVVAQGVNGLIVPPDDVEALRDAVITLLGDTPQRREMESRNRELVSDEYSISKVTDKLLCLYSQLAMRKV